MTTSAPYLMPVNTPESSRDGDGEHESILTTAAERYAIAWQQVLNDDMNTESLFETLKESCARASWTGLGFGTFGEFCTEYLRLDEDCVASILARRFGQRRARLLMVAQARQGRRTDRSSTSSSDCSKSSRRTDATVRATLIALERAPSLEQIVDKDLLPWDLSAKLGRTDLTESQVEKVKDLGGEVAKWLTLPPKDAKRLIRNAVEDIVGRPKSAGERIGDQLRHLEVDDLRHALKSVSTDLLRQALPMELLVIVPNDGALVSADPGLAADDMNTANSPVDVQHVNVAGLDGGNVEPHSVEEVNRSRDAGEMGDSTGRDENELADEHVASVLKPENSHDDEEGVRREASDEMSGEPIGDGVAENGDAIGAEQLSSGPNWRKLEAAARKPLDVHLEGLGSDTQGLGCLDLPAESSTLDLILGTDVARFHSKCINRRLGCLANAASVSNMHALAEGESAPPGATVSLVFVDDSTTMRWTGHGMVSSNGELPDKLVFPGKDGEKKRVILCGPATSTCFGAVAGIFVHRAEAIAVLEAAE